MINLANQKPQANPIASSAIPPIVYNTGEKFIMSPPQISEKKREKILEFRRSYIIPARIQYETLPELCDLCGTEMTGARCKLTCPVCHYRRDCSDP